jgi:predicted Zn-dependent protease
VHGVHPRKREKVDETDTRIQEARDGMSSFFRTRDGPKNRYIQAVAMTSMVEHRRQSVAVRLAFQMAAILTLISLPACGFPETIRRLWRVQAAVAHAAGTGSGAVSVNLANGRYLVIAIDNPARSERPDQVREKALMLAKAAYAAYDLRSTLEQVTVTFPTVHTALFLVTVRRVGAEDAFRFRSSDLIATAGVDRAMSAPPESVAVYLLPIGDVPSDLMEQMALRLRRRFPIPLTVLPAAALDPTAYDDRRGQAVADNLIASIAGQYASLLREADARIIAVTAYDMYIRTEQWAFAFSLRGVNNRIAVVSYARMQPNLFGNAPDEVLLHSRVRKMVTKDIGIMCYGFPMSQNPRSVLYGLIGGTDELDVMTEDFDPLD